MRAMTIVIRPWGLQCSHDHRLFEGVWVNPDGAVQLGRPRLLVAVQSGNIQGKAAQSELLVLTG